MFKKKGKKNLLEGNCWIIYKYSLHTHESDLEWEFSCMCATLIIYKY